MYVIDGHGNFGRAITWSGGAGFPSVGGGMVIQGTAQDTIHGLKGWGGSVGGSASLFAIANLGADWDIMTGGMGATGSAALILNPLLVELHGMIGLTRLNVLGNIFEDDLSDLFTRAGVDLVIGDILDALDFVQELLGLTDTEVNRIKEVLYEIE